MGVFMNVTEAFNPVDCPVNAATNFKAIEGVVGGFVAKVAGTLTIVIGGVTVVNAQPVAVGWNALPFAVPAGDGVATTAGGAVGTLAVR